MKRYYKYLPVLFIILLMAYACEQPEKEVIVEDEEVEEASAPGPVYDSVKAKAYGADTYGMRKYVMAFLKRGPNREADSVKAAELQKAHMDNINRLAEEGTLVMAGPFFGDGELRGIYIFAVNSIEEAEALTNSDPAIQSGSLVMELKEWYGSAALMEMTEVHMTIAKEII